ncbi:MAG: hypothetical protein WCT50_02280 [Patescibacteria group bacterium]
MEKQDHLPYHQSLVKFLEIIELDSQEFISMEPVFICRFRLESAVLLSHMQIVKIPEKELNFTAVNLLSFYKEFMIRYEHLMDEATSFSKVNEKEVIGHCFMNAVHDLISRPSESPEIPELETINWFDVPDDQSDEALGLRLAGELLLNKGLSVNQITSLCGKAAWFMKNYGDIRSAAMEKVLKIECPNFFREWGSLFIKTWTWPSQLTESEFATVKTN